MIDRALLLEKREKLNEAVILHQGGIQVIDHLLQILDQQEGKQVDAIDEADFAEMIGGNGAIAEVISHD